ncbi:hypothetical protein CU098_001136, partial [Rhizopus stolonifer]
AKVEYLEKDLHLSKQTNTMLRVFFKSTEERYKSELTDTETKMRKLHDLVRNLTEYGKPTPKRRSLRTSTTQPKEQPVQKNALIKPSAATTTQTIKRSLTPKIVQSGQVSSTSSSKSDTKKIDLGKKNSVDLGKKNSVDLGKKNSVDLGKKNSVDLGKKNSVDLGKKTSPSSLDSGKKNSADATTKRTDPVKKADVISSAKKNSIDAGKKRRDKKNLTEDGAEEEDKQVDGMRQSLRSKIGSFVRRSSQDQVSKKRVNSTDLGRHKSSTQSSVITRSNKTVPEKEVISLGVVPEDQP